MQRLVELVWMDTGQVFNDSAVPSPDVEMLNTLRGTGIQVELHEVRMMMIVIIGNIGRLLQNPSPTMTFATVDSR